MHRLRVPPVLELYAHLRRPMKLQSKPKRLKSPVP